MQTYIVTTERWVREMTTYQVHADSEEDARARGINHARGAGRQAMWSLTHPYVCKDEQIVTVKKIEDP